MPKQGKSTIKSKYKVKPEYNKSIKNQVDHVKKFNAKKTGIPGWVWYTEHGKLPRKEAMEHFRDLKHYGKIKRFPHQYWLVRQHTTENYKRAKLWEYIYKLMKLGLPREEAIYAAKHYASLMQQWDRHPNEIPPQLLVDITDLQLSKRPL
jgi:hypothetical protein